MVCALDRSHDCRAALELSVDLSERLRLRLVLAHADEAEAPLVGQLATEYGVADRAEQRSGAGDPATLIGRIAAEEAADLIVIGAQTRGWPRRGLESRLAGQLRNETPVPVLIAPPQRGRR